MRELTLLSLFDGSGGFPLAASMCGIRPVACSEVEPYPIAVTRSRFPNMKHLGSVTDIKGGDIEPVDIITFGSPCQDLSVAGKRAGLKHEANGDEETTRSGLFMEAVRIIKEMRKATNGEYPTFAVWENVPGAFSSNKGEDFRTVLEELIKIVEPTAVMPEVPKNGWPYADSYCGDGWSLAYRVFDAQYWGVPQRRRRIYLVLDLRGQCAREVLFERESLRRDFETFKTSWQGTAGDAADRTGADDCEGKGNCLTPWDYQGKRVYSADGVFPTLYSAENSGQQQQAVCLLVMDTPENCKYQAEGNCLTPWDVQSRRIFSVDGPWPSLYGGEGGGHGYACIPYPLKIRSGCEGGGKGALIQEDKPATLATNNDQYLFQPIAFAQNQRDEVRDLKDKAGALAAEPGMKQQTFVAVPCNPKFGDPCHPLAAQGHPPTVICKEQYLFENHSQDTRYKGPLDISPIVSATFGMGGNNQPFVVEEAHAFSLQGNTIDRNAQQNGSGICEDVAHTLNTVDRHGVCYCMATQQGGAEIMENLCPTITASAGMSGNNQPVVCEPAVAFTMQAFGNYKDCGVCSGLKARDYKDATDLVVESAGIDCRNFTGYPELYPTLQAKPNGGQSLNFSGDVRVQYIVRRLTPTEYARLQGFPDNWGHPDHKVDFTDEDYRFWLNVRNTHAAINGKPQKDYTKAQMLTWYNKLHTDSSEYKMYGNGIALPCALYVMQGIKEALIHDGMEIDNRIRK